MAITLYGIRNCDTVKKARALLDELGVDYAFHDFKKAGLTQAHMASWLAHVPVDTLINKRGTSWRALTPEQREPLTNDLATSLALANPSLIKRPVVDWGDELTVGFDAPSWRERLAEHG